MLRCVTTDLNPLNEPVKKPATEGLTCDAFLGGLVHLWQPKKGYRAGVDPVLLAASVDAVAGQSVLDVGCGAGAAALCLGRRVSGLELHGLEIQPFYAELAARNAAVNDLKLTLHEGDISAMPEALKARRFDHVITNPPYYNRVSGPKSGNVSRETARAGASLDVWMEAAARRLAPKGQMTIICRTERMPELLGAMPSYLGSVELWPLIPRAGRGSELALLKARHGGRTPFKLHDGLCVHEGHRHLRDGESYSKTIASVLRHGAALPFPKG